MKCWENIGDFQSGDITIVLVLLWNHQQFCLNVKRPPIDHHTTIGQFFGFFGFSWGFSWVVNTGERYFKITKWSMFFLKTKTLKKKCFWSQYAGGALSSFFLILSSIVPALISIFTFLRFFLESEKFSFFMTNFSWTLLRNYLWWEKNELIFIICWGLDLGNSLE